MSLPGRQNADPRVDQAAVPRSGLDLGADLAAFERGARVSHVTDGSSGRPA